MPRRFRGGGGGDRGFGDGGRSGGGGGGGPSGGMSYHNRRMRSASQQHRHMRLRGAGGGGDYPGWDKMKLRLRASETKYKMMRREGRRNNRRMGAQSRYHLRRRYHMHNSMAGGAGGVDHEAAIMLGLVGGDPFDELDDGDDALHADLKDAMAAAGITDSDSDGDDVDDHESGPPPLESVDQMHAFFYYVGGGTEIDIVESFVSDLEAPPLVLKCLTNQRDFKTDLTPVQNVILSIGISQRTVVICTQRFIDKDLHLFCTAAGLVMAEDERRAKIQVLLSQDVSEAPKELSCYPVFKLADDDALDRLLRVLSSGPVPKDQYKPEPTAPPLDTIAEDVASTDAIDAAITPVPPGYQNGTVVTKITSCGRRRYSRREVDVPDDLGSGSRNDVATDDQCGLDVCRGFCPSFASAEVHCPVVVPSQLQQRGLMVHRDEYEEILVALRDATAVKFFHKSVYCSLPRLYLCIIIIMAAVVIPLWFLTVGAAKQHRPREDLATAYFWSFFVVIVIAPAIVALVTLAVVLRVANKKFVKFRTKVEDFNRRFRETNLVLHCRRSFWRCSGTLRLYFIYYNFEDCQQTLYYYVYDNMRNGANDSTCNSSSATTDVNVVTVESGRRVNGLSNGDLCSPGYGGLGSYIDCGDIPTIKMDKILKRVNTLRNKYEWDYFDALMRRTLPETDERQHRKCGMCFCQYAMHRSGSDASSSWIEQLAERCESTLRSVLSKSGGQRAAPPTPSRTFTLPLSPTTNGGTSAARLDAYRANAQAASTLPKPDVIYI